MPYYRFVPQNGDPPPDDLPLWLVDDVAALKIAARIAAGLAKKNNSPPVFVVVVRFLHPRQ